MKFKYKLLLSLRSNIMQKLSRSIFYCLHVHSMCGRREIYWFELHANRDTVCNAVEQSLIVAVHYIFYVIRKQIIKMKIAIADLAECFLLI
jgi:hypothetical protein